MTSSAPGNPVIVKQAQPITPTDRVAILAGYSASAAPRPHADYYAGRLAACGFRVILVLAHDGRDAGRSHPYQDNPADIVILRNNGGFDFGSWADAFRLLPELHGARSCLLTNDSVIGPFDGFERVMHSVFAHETQVDLAALTDNLEVMYHLQSYFLHLSARLLAADCFRMFMQSIQPFTQKFQVINLYEIPLARFVSMSGFRTGALFRSADFGITDARNLTMCRWRELLQRGYPFVKTELLRDNPCHADIDDWQQVLRDHGYDTRLTDGLLGQPR